MKKTYPDVDASPVKSFFVTMLTRDISLSDAILDLLDNCVDGILRKKKRVSGKTPYKGFYAEITFNKDTFTIHDNCGGIPWDLHEYAFRMGRPAGRRDKTTGTVGTYGIGMKRAIFKIGQECLISTQSGSDNYEVEISTDWLNDEKNWSIPVQKGKKSMKEDGTTIVVDGLHKGISAQFGRDRASFEAEFVKQVASHYAFIIAKGFEVRVNGKPVKPRPTQILFSRVTKGKKGIRPYIYKAEMDGVEVFLTVGFTRPIPSQEEVQDEQEERRYSSFDAGWTVVCNDRAVLYCDKSEMTGWGEAGVPQYHTQFIAISGVVEFRSNQPEKLPTTTTKRGIDASSSLYLQVKNRMREGMKRFTDYTNWWKADIQKSKEHMKEGSRLTFEEIKKKSSSLNFSQARKGIGGQYYLPDLPKPPPKEPQRKRISFMKDTDDIRIVAEYLFNDSDANPSQVGENCFDDMLRRAKK